MKIKIICLLIIAFNYSFTLSDSRIRSIIVKCEDGGEKGFNSVDLDCNSQTGKVELVCRGKGYAKAEICKWVLKDSTLNDIVDRLSDSIKLNHENSFIFEYKKYYVKAKIKDKYNYQYSVILEKD